MHMKYPIQDKPLEKVFIKIIWYIFKYPAKVMSWLFKKMKISILLLLLCHTVYAQEFDIDIARKQLPEGRRITLTGGTYQAFNLDEYKKLLELGFDFYICGETGKIKDGMLNDYEKDIELYRLTAEKSTKLVDMLKKERDKLFEDWKDENNRRLEAELQVESVWPWVGIAVGSLMAATGIPLYFYNRPVGITLIGSGIVVDGLFSLQLLKLHF